MKDNGVDPGSNIVAYFTREEYQTQVKALAAQGKRAAFVYSHKTSILNETNAVNSNAALQFLNNKANIGALVEEHCIAKRRIISLADKNALRDVSTPIVIKVPTDDPNAGGIDVHVCRNQRHLARAIKRFSNAPSIIAEQYVEATENWCIQFSVKSEYDIEHLGESQQICMRNGAHGGNIIRADQVAPAAAVNAAHHAVAEASTRGFVGLCGVDVLIDGQQQAYVIDLNFRPVSSVGFLHAYQKIKDTSPPIHRLAMCSFDGPFQELARLCEQGFKEEWLIPLATFDPIWGRIGAGPSRIRLSIMADDIGQLSDRENALAKQGLSFLGYEEATQRPSNLFSKLISPIFRSRSDVH